MENKIQLKTISVYQIKADERMMVWGIYSPDCLTFNTHLIFSDTERCIYSKNHRAYEGMDEEKVMRNFHEAWKRGMYRKKS